jgi:phosphinothricin acetyltransferase
MIRHANPATDAAACAAIYAPHVASGVASFEETVPSEAQMAQRIELCSASHAWLVAEHDGEVVGYAYATPHRERAAYRWSVEVSVYVAAGHGGRGIGRELYEALFALLRRQGIVTVLAGITLPNDASVRLHESFGFTACGIFEHIGFKAGAWHDVGWWQLELQHLGDAPADPQL